MPTKTKVKVSQTAEGIQIHLIGKQAAKYDARLIEQCAGSLIACAESNACLQSGFRLTDKCVDTLVAHNKNVKCMTKGFGLVARRG